MTRTIRHHFDTPERADGFIEGVEWVNDSAITFVDTTTGSNEIIVIYQDDDHGDDDLDLYYDVEPS